MVDVNIIIDMKNGPVIYRNTYIKPYNHYTKEAENSHPKTANSLAEIPINKLSNDEIFTPLNYSEAQRSH